MTMAVWLRDLADLYDKRAALDEKITDLSRKIGVQSVVAPRAKADHGEVPPGGARNMNRAAEVLLFLETNGPASASVVAEKVCNDLGDGAKAAASSTLHNLQRSDRVLSPSIKGGKWEITEKGRDYLRTHGHSVQVPPPMSSADLLQMVLLALGEDGCQTAAQIKALVYGEQIPGNADRLISQALAALKQSGEVVPIAGGRWDLASNHVIRRVGGGAQ